MYSKKFLSQCLYFRTIQTSMLENKVDDLIITIYKQGRMVCHTYWAEFHDVRSFSNGIFSYFALGQPSQRLAEPNFAHFKTSREDIRYLINLI